MSIRIVLDSGVWYLDARVRMLESGVRSHDSGFRPLLQAIRESLQPGQVWLFPGRSSGHLCTKTVLRTIDRLAEEAGIQEVSPRQKLSRKKVTPHILRHSHVVNALMAGVPVPMIQIAGWGTRGCLRRRFTLPWRQRW
ncbi:MAG: tyrosine-type recombinase/integrase [Methanothrix sp.]